MIDLHNLRSYWYFNLVLQKKRVGGGHSPHNPGRINNNKKIETHCR